ncbi:hypothetical protein BOTBODRAFT_346180 [Botryobasidium botryosum FD-172 SS1]|uniref:Uncharacterized protein n=1 Tax=Botryobasidium botryosum (strain FD-172 SS1) TaxID=930990 RepID=A0A067MGB9_BOTB1|nr:hypothetical protein BOTBODRAFT_346180 [Botryobasidium botryosum FD-172 SS1]
MQAALNRVRGTAATRCLLRSRSFCTSQASSSGHNKWSKIHRDKAVEDRKRSMIYSKASHEILSAVRCGGSVDPAVNVALAVALKKARTAGVPKDNIANALNKASNPAAFDSLQTVLYEALGPAQIPLLVECMLDNTSRTIKEIRKILTKHDARFAPVAYQFVKKGRIRLNMREGASWDEVWETAVEAGAEDVSEADPDTGEIQILTPVTELNNLSTLLSSPPHSHSLSSAELAYLPSDSDGIPELEETDAEKIQTLIEDLEDDPDCSRVWTLAG